MKKSLLLILLLFVVMWACPAFAKTNAIVRAVQQYKDLFLNLKPLVYICGAFGLMSIACAGFFGKMDWSRLTFVGIALLFLSMAGAIVDYLVNSNGEEFQIDGKSFAEALDKADSGGGE